MDSFTHMAITVKLNCSGLLKIALEFDLPVSYFVSKVPMDFIKKNDQYQFFKLF